MQHQQGFSVIKMLFWLAILFAGVMYAYQVVPVYNAYWKVQDAFSGVVENMAGDSEIDIRKRLPDLFRVKYLKQDDLPREFYDNLEIKADGNRVEISSFYHVTVWFLGPVTAVDPESDYDPEELKGMDRVRNRLRQDFDFEPHAATP